MIPRAWLPLMTAFVRGLRIEPLEIFEAVPISTSAAVGFAEAKLAEFEKKGPQKNTDLTISLNLKATQSAPFWRAFREELQVPQITRQILLTPTDAGR